MSFLIPKNTLIFYFWKTKHSFKEPPYIFHLELWHHTCLFIVSILHETLNRAFYRMKWIKWEEVFQRIKLGKPWCDLVRQDCFYSCASKNGFAFRVKGVMKRWISNLVKFSISAYILCNFNWCSMKQNQLGHCSAWPSFLEWEVSDG